ncbi:hypothetical protein EC973_004250 [Apophysomyces ossiformis]|uniref:AB hydrolase-1 domain-containing protein n=1 Tax=Apophysomyces ossiformis TaxID=679940 RepID=A0A8H7BXI8_9FUNG|nr:hypothetical protein EC973_004250 [Apophysomyces ossiformis]
MWIPDTSAARALVLSVIVLLSAVTLLLTKQEAPLPALLSALAHTLILLVSILIHVWLALEVAFWIYFLMARQRLQKERYPSKTLSSKERIDIFWNCLHTITDIKTWAVGWYYDAETKEHPTFDEIRRENVALWFAWAFWHDHLDRVERIPKYKAELDWMITTTEKHFKVIFPKGYNQRLQCIRLNLDPVQAVHRPLIFYVVIYLCTVMFNALFLEAIWEFKQCQSLPGVLWGGFLSWIDRWRGHHHYHHHHPPNGKNSQVQHSVATENDNHRDKGEGHHSVVYWYRPVPDSTKTPLVFIHGIGAGPLCYGEFIHRLAHLDRPMFCVELPYVSMHMVEMVPTAEETVQSIKTMLQTHGHEQAIVVAHSLGTAVTSWLMSMAPECIAGTVMIDPICFLLHYHHVGFNFVHRIPKRPLEYILYYCASRELHISHYISRHFQWFQTIFFVHPTSTSQPPCLPTVVEPNSPLSNAAIFLSERDGIVDSLVVATYLKERGVNAKIMPGMEHAEFLVNWKWRKHILEQVEYIGKQADDRSSVLKSHTHTLSNL